MRRDGILQTGLIVVFVVAVGTDAGRDEGSARAAAFGGGRAAADCCGDGLLVSLSVCVCVCGGPF